MIYIKTHLNFTDTNMYMTSITHTDHKKDMVTYTEKNYIQPYINRIKKRKWGEGQICVRIDRQALMETYIHNCTGPNMFILTTSFLIVQNSQMNI